MISITTDTSAKKLKNKQKLKFMKKLELIIALIVFTTIFMTTSCSKEKMYTCTCDYTWNSPSQWSKPAEKNVTVYHGPSKEKAQEAYNNNHGDNGTSTGYCVISVK